ncbi:MAG: hypothetical protein Athens071412_696, partial [Parcubacteria group bacterium Athens0714_12]
MDLKSFKFKKIIRVYLVITFILISFCFGLFIGYKNNPKVKLADNNKEDGQVLNKETKPEYLSKDV